MRCSVFSLVVGILVVVHAVLAQDKPIPPADAPQHMALPDGFHVTMFAGEPDLVQPIAFTHDDRGRLWVVECYSYPHWLTTGEGKDRILIFEDSDNDGRFDTRKVFFDKGTNLSGLQLGFGGVWLCSLPNLIFIPDCNADDVPDGPAVVLLDGWDLKAKHNVFNSLTWGPDGWLYGCNGILSNSTVGKPGTPPEQRVAVNCGVWRYHPSRHVFEVVANGTTNPWGLDFDDLGQMFITNCVIHHLWHVVPGAHFQRMYGQDFNPHLYGLLGSCADHIHWGGGAWTESRGSKGVHDQPGGGHAHVGAMVYLGDNWPDRYRQSVFMCNLHGSRVNQDLLERKGSGYVAHHGKDFLVVRDPWFRGLSIHYGPDGGVFVSDWTDTGECHNYDNVHLSGRIYKITYDKVTPARVDLARLEDAELVWHQLHKNDWYVRHARRLLQERAVAGRLANDTRPALRRILRDHPHVTRQLRALWALHVTGGVEESLMVELLDHQQELLRAWTVQLALESRTPSAGVRGRLAAMAGNDPSPLVRLYLASGLQRLPLEQRWPIAEGLTAHAEDAPDAYLPLMIWYGIEPLAQANPDRFVALIGKTKIPLIREYIARRVAFLTAGPATALPGLRPLVQALNRIDDPDIAVDVLRGLHEALDGRRRVAMPEGWPTLYQKLAASPLDEIREKAVFLAVLFDDQPAVASLRQVLDDASAPIPRRERALRALISKKNPALVPVLQKLVAERGLRAAAVRGLAAYDDTATPGIILQHYASLTDAEKSDAIQTLASRPAYAVALLDALEQNKVARQDLSAFIVRQMLGLKDKRVSEKIKKVWGVLRPAAQEKAPLMARYKSLLTPQYLKQANPCNGRVVFARTCASCHILFDEGGKIGPALTGAQRGNLDYFLENALDPSAVVPREYQVTLVQTRDGRVITGIIQQENDQVVTVQTPNELLRIPHSEIEARVKSSLSMMPEGLLATLKDEEVRDLVAYLASPTQVPLPKDAKAGTGP